MRLFDFPRDPHRGIMDRWDRLAVNPASQRPQLLENEIELFLVSNVALYDQYMLGV